MWGELRNHDKICGSTAQIKIMATGRLGKEETMEQ